MGFLESELYFGQVCWTLCFSLPLLLSGGLSCLEGCLEVRWDVYRACDIGAGMWQVHLPQEDMNLGSLRVAPNLLAAAVSSTLQHLTPYSVLLLLWYNSEFYWDLNSSHGTWGSGWPAFWLYWGKGMVLCWNEYGWLQPNSMIGCVPGSHATGGDWCPIWREGAWLQSRSRGTDASLDSSLVGWELLLGSSILLEFLDSSSLRCSYCSALDTLCKASLKSFSSSSVWFLRGILILLLQMMV